jgi:hypothetical protein
MSDFGAEHRYNVTGLFHDMWGFPSNNPKVVKDLLHHLVDKIENNVHVITRYKEHFLDDAEYILISYGSSARSAIHLAKDRRERGEKIGVLELQSLWPFPEAVVKKVCRDQCGNRGGDEYGTSHASGQGLRRPSRERLFGESDRRQADHTEQYQGTPQGHPGEGSIIWLSKIIYGSGSFPICGVLAAGMGRC